MNFSQGRKNLIRARDDMYFLYKDWLGIKAIPKCGTNTIRQELGATTRRREEWEAASTRAVCMRNPEDRLWSAYRMLGGDMTPDEWLLAEMDKEPTQQNWHWMPVATQIKPVAHLVTHWIDIAHWNEYPFLPRIKKAHNVGAQREGGFSNFVKKQAREYWAKDWEYYEKTKV